MSHLEPISQAPSRKEDAPNKPDPSYKAYNWDAATRFFLTIMVCLCVMFLLVAYVITGNTILLVADGTVAGAAFVTIITYYFSNRNS